MKITLGADPELALFDKTKDRIVPAVGLVPGTKENPHRLDKGSVQLDGTAIELGIDPASSPDEFLDNLATVIKQVQDIVGDNYQLRCGPCVAYYKRDCKFSESVFEVGCSPDYVVRLSADRLFTLRERTEYHDIHYRKVPLGGHIHVGFGCDLDIKDPVLVQSAARYASQVYNNFASFFVSDKYANRRSAAMGNLTGTIRVKPYGVELRQYDPRWLFSSEAVKGMFMFHQQQADVLSGTYRVGSDRESMQLMVHLVKQMSAEVDKKYQGTLPLFTEEGL